MDQYHPKRKRNEILEDDAKQALLGWGNHITLALCDNNIPYIVTMSYGYDAARNALYFHCANKGDKLDFIRRNPAVCATLIRDNGYLETKCDHDYESLVIRGKMSIVDELHEKKHGLQVLLDHLENDPQPIFERNIKSDRSYDAVTILRLDMDAIIGKKYIG
ncbi:MAG TPA: pyridoxamine 5'-phosphate oxidase family protein [bacterium]|nr:pyridoxamine 5'-phosphate oxidase family protein [bacterium]